jgi:tRNA A-37 threonylcarbamoyl transferase component Bud32
MGSVFEAEDTGLGHRVALKVLHPHIARRGLAMERFMREGRSAARVRHPHIVQVLALGIDDGTPYLAMELLEGEDLAQHIAREGALPVEDALDLVLPIVSAIAAAHDAGVIHRDLKPSNICITRGPGGRALPKVVDFGVSKVLVGDGTDEFTATDGVVGTAAYMAPEQARAACDASFQSDQYSLAALLYQCVTGELPFSGRSVYEIVESIMTRPLVAPSARVAGIPGVLDEVILRAMNRVPLERFPSVRSFGAALLPLASEHTRIAFGSDFHDGAGPNGSESCSGIARDVSWAVDSGTGAATRGDTPATAMGSHRTRSTSTRVGRAMWIGGVGLVGVVALFVAPALGTGASSGAAGVSHELRAAIATSLRPEAGRRRAEPAHGEDIPEHELVPPAPAQTKAPLRGAAPQRVRAPSPHRRDPPAIDPANVRLGDNDAPILP